MKDIGKVQFIHLRFMIVKILDNIVKEVLNNQQIFVVKVIMVLYVKVVIQLAIIMKIKHFLNQKILIVIYAQTV